MLEIKFDGEKYSVYKGKKLLFTVKRWYEIWERV